MDTLLSVLLFSCFLFQASNYIDQWNWEAFFFTTAQSSLTAKKPKGYPVTPLYFLYKYCSKSYTSWSLTVTHSFILAAFSSMIFASCSLICFWKKIDKHIFHWVLQSAWVVPSDTNAKIAWSNSVSWAIHGDLKKKDEYALHKGCHSFLL